MRVVFIAVEFGFYAKFDQLQKADKEASFGFLDNIDITDENSAWDYLHGRCDEFAAMLSEVYGYGIEAVRNAEGRLIHAYCVSQIGGEKAYIDVRGITTDPKLFYEEFENELTFYAPTRDLLVVDEDGYEVDAGFEIWMNKDDLFEGEYEGWTDARITSFIKNYADYYNTDNYIGVFKCKCCGDYICEDPEYEDWFEYCGEEELWGHIQLGHPEIFKECQNLETPYMLEECYEYSVERVGFVPEKKVALDDQIRVASERALNELAADKDKNIGVER